MQVVVKVSQVFIGVGSEARRYRRGDLVELDIKSAKDIPKWAESIEVAEEKFKKREPEPEQPKTLSEMAKKGGKRKAFGQDIDQE